MPLTTTITTDSRYYPCKEDIGVCGDKRFEDRRDDPGSVSPASTSGTPSPASVTSIPFAVPMRAPASATISIGAAGRLYPDLIRLFDTDSL